MMSSFCIADQPVKTQKCCMVIVVIACVLAKKVDLKIPDMPRAKA